MVKITLDWYSESGSWSISTTCTYQAPVVQKVDSAIHRIKIYPVNNAIDLFIDTAAILNLLDLRSIMGSPGGTRSVFMRAFRAKRELHYMFLGKKAISSTFKHSTTIFFSHLKLFLGKLREKLPRKARVNAERVYRIALMPPWTSHYTP